MISQSPSGAEARDGRGSGRERISAAAYELFRREGTLAVGVDTVVARAGTAKMTLYRNFSSKEDLILDFLQRRERVWTIEWLQAEADRRGHTPARRLLAIFDAFSDWFHGSDFDGCAFLSTMIETKDPDSPVRKASIDHLSKIREIIEAYAVEAGVTDAEQFAHQWHLLMKGAIMAAHEGDLAAADRARELGVLLLRSRGVEVD